MSVISQTGTSEKYPSVSFRNIGDAVVGRIVALDDYQQKEYNTNPNAPVVLKFWPKSGDPMMGVRVTLETNPGDPTSRVTLWGEGKKLLMAIAGAVKGKGAPDLEVGGDLAVTFTGYDGRAKTYAANYERPESAEAAE